MARGEHANAVALYVGGKSIPSVFKDTGIPLSTMRRILKEAGVLRSRADGVRLAASEGRLGAGMRGKKRTFTPEHKAAIKAAADARGERDARGVSVKPSGYVEITRGPNKGRTQHRVIAEQIVGRPLRRDEVVHHHDHNRAHNAPENLEVMPLRDHTSKHRKGEI